MWADLAKITFYCIYAISADFTFDDRILMPMDGIRFRSLKYRLAIAGRRLFKNKPSTHQTYETRTEENPTNKTAPRLEERGKYVSVAENFDEASIFEEQHYGHELSREDFLLYNVMGCTRGRRQTRYEGFQGKEDWSE